MKITPEPFTKIAAGVDFSSESDVAVRTAMNLARRHGAALVLIHVENIAEQPSGLVSIDVATNANWQAAASAGRAQNRKRLMELRDQLDGDGVAVSQAIVGGYADTSLAMAAKELGADLIVVGSHGYTGFKRILLGSVAEKTVRLAETSVLVVRGGEPANGYTRLVIGSDFSPQADRALARALGVAAQEAELHVVACWEPHAPLFGVDPVAFESDAVGAMARRTREALGDGANALALRAIRHDVVETTPIAGLEAAAMHDRADLVVVGSHGRRGLRRMVLGSVAEAIVRHAPCSVLIAR